MTLESRLLSYQIDTMSLVSGPGRGGVIDSGISKAQRGIEMCAEKHIRYIQELDKVFDAQNYASTTLMAKRGKMNMSTG